MKNVKALTKNPLLIGSILMVGGSMGVNIVNYLYHLVMGRIMGPLLYGELASVFSILYLTSVVPMATSFAIVKFISEAKSKNEQAAIYLQIRKVMWKIAGFSGILVLVLSPIIANFLHIDDMVSIALVGPIIFFSLITLVNQSSMQGVLRFIGLVGPNFTSAVFKLAIGVTLVMLGFGLSGAVFAILIAVIFAYYFSLKLKGDLFTNPKNNTFDVKPVFIYAFPVLIQALAFTSFFTLDVMLVKHYLSGHDAGLYAAIATLGKIIFFATQPITATMFPIVTGKRSSGEKYRHIFFAAFFFTIFISLSIVAIYYLFPDIAIGVLFGKEYLEASSELVWMGIFMSVYTASYILVNFLLSVNHTKVVILPLIGAVAQVIGIVKWHASILEVIQVSLVSILFVLAGVSLYLAKHELAKIYEKKRK